MVEKVERRKEWHRTIGIERRGAPLNTLEGRPLPDPTLLLDEDFQEALREAEKSAAFHAGDIQNRHH